MFREGDIVRCTTHRYVYTSYMRPCTVQGYDGDGKLIIQPFDKSSIFDIDDEGSFEIVPPKEILRYGQEILLEGCNHKVVFEKYLNKGWIQVLNNDWREEVNIKRVIYEKGFYI
mgnify:CR=1 FL=1